MEGSAFTSFAIAGLVLSTLAGCNSDGAKPSGTSTDPARTTAQIRSAIRKQVGAYAARDLQKAVSNNAPDIISMFHGRQTLVGQAAHIETVKAHLADPALRLVLAEQAIDVAGSGDLAVYRATYSFRYTDPANRQPVTEVGNWIAGFKRQPDGSMKIAWEVVSDIPMPQQPDANAQS